MRTGNPVTAMMGRKLRLALAGGGPGSFIGPMHRAAALMDGRYDIVAGALSSDPAKCAAGGAELGIAPERSYADLHALLAGERARADGAEVLAIMTPNDSHAAYALAAIRAGMDVICDKPMTRTLAEAEALHAEVVASGKVFCLTHNYSGYPMVRQARAMVAAGMLGAVRLVQVEYVQGGRAGNPERAPGAELPWRMRAEKSGPSLVLGDIGSHAHQLLRYVTGLEVEGLCAEAGSVVPGRDYQDFAGALLRLAGSARGSFWATQAAAGVENSLAIRVSGSEGTVEWNQERPQVLWWKPIAGAARMLTPGGPESLPLAARAVRVKAGHPEGFPEAFANLYSDAAEAIAARRTGGACDPLALHFPGSLDGLIGMRFIDAMLASSAAGGAWVDCG